MLIFLSPFLMTLGLAQLVAAHKDWQGASLSGAHHRIGKILATAMLLAGATLLPHTPWVFFLVLPSCLLALLFQVVVGSWLGRDLDPAYFLRPGNWDKGRCAAFDIPGPDGVIPALLFDPPDALAVVCLVHGSGDSKTSYKWRLIEALLDRNLAVLAIDLAGHGQNPAPQRWPACTKEIPAVLDWLRSQLPERRVGLLGISMGGALSAQAAVFAKPDALVLCETPISFRYSRGMIWREGWDTFRSPLLGLFREVTVWKLWKMWRVEQGRREISLTDLIQRLDVPDCVKRLSCSILLVYGLRDHIAPVSHGRRLCQVAGDQCQMIEVPGASHLALTLLPGANDAIASWLAVQLIERHSSATQ